MVPSEVRRVVCSAVRAADGCILLGLRHYSHDMLNQIAQRTDGAKFRHRTGADQGFVDQFGVYLTREEAYWVASNAGQITNYAACETHPKQRLYSEGLY